MFFKGRREADLGIRKRDAERRLSLGPVSAKVVLIVIVASLAVFYLGQAGQSQTKKITTSDLEQSLKNEQNEIDRLDVEKNRLKSLSIIQDEAAKKGMESAGQ
jgi:cell division protein FtsL